MYRNYLLLIFIHFQIMKNKTGWIVGGIVFVLLVGGVTYYIINKKNRDIAKTEQENKQLTQTFEQDKRDLEGEYTGFAQQYGELRIAVKNEKMSAKLKAQQDKIHSLLQQLHSVKASNATEILRLKRELETMRKIMIAYIQQIDSLNRENKNLREQTAAITSKYNTATLQISSLSEEKEHLNNRVKLAAQLDATNIALTAQNKKGKIAKKVKDIKKFEVSFTIAKNITAETGNRTIYVRITKPDNSILGNGGTMKYENRSIPYTMDRTVEYSGENLQVVMFWSVDEFLYAGTYRVDLFSGGNLIGSRSFSFNK